MATLSRQAVEYTRPITPGLAETVPTPFPIDTFRSSRAVDSVILPNDHAAVVSREESSAPPSLAKEIVPSVEQESCTDVLPSITHVQQSCIITLNTLLSPTHPHWQPILPPRRHSVPSSLTHAADETYPALHTLVANLRALDSGHMIETRSTGSDTELVRELQIRINSLASTLSNKDIELASALVSLLAHTTRLAQLAPPVANGQTIPSASMWHPYGPPDIYDTLSRQVLDLRQHRENFFNPANTSHVNVVEESLLWTKIDDDLDVVLNLCRNREDPFADPVPPEYHPGDTAQLPPEYVADLPGHLPEKEKLPRASTSSATAGTTLNEKMRMDLDAITMAIDRLYLVAPQLHSQRVELKKAKIEQMEKARLAGPNKSVAKGKTKQEDDLEDLDKILSLLNKASSRRMVDQSVVVDDSMHSRLVKAKERDDAKREAFVQQLMDHSGSRRLHAQDAVLQPRIRNPETLLTLPEFIRESRDIQVDDPETLLTLPEFVRTVPPPEELLYPGKSKKSAKVKTRARAKSLSAPGSWLKVSSKPENRSALGTPSPLRAGLDVHYVAEHQENIKNVIVFLTIDGAPPGVDVQAEVPPSGNIGGDRLLIRAGPSWSPPLSLPARVTLGRQEVRVVGDHLEIKLTTLGDALPSQSESPLLDATQLGSIKPTSYICASCSLPLVHSSKVTRYDDLPSDHWAELLEAWMCHQDQKLISQVSQHSTGFFPKVGQCLVGGSYLLFDKGVIVQANVKVADQPKRGEEWYIVKCICGSTAGRSRIFTSNNETRTTFRLAKYAVRPVSASAEPVRLPLSAFIVGDMVELVHAHAAYRFIIIDEDEEKPRLLIWLFKPSLRLTYAGSNQYLLGRSGSIFAAKVLFKILGPASPSDLTTMFTKYPGFTQAEHLLYPLDICRRLAGMLKESNFAYPENCRGMSGLDVGWLQHLGLSR